MESAFFDNTRLYTFCSKMAKKAEKTAKVLPLLPHILFATT